MLYSHRMKVLVGCEESAKVREAFTLRGHDAYSCDLLPTRVPGQHLQIDIFKAITCCGPWDLIILHPDCTKLTVSGNRWYGSGMDRNQERHDAIVWTECLWNAAKLHSKRVALENPVGVLSGSSLGKPTQIIQPWQYGHGETKKTCLWLHNLPPLTPTDIVEGREQRIWKMAPGENRKRDRSETYQGWADAMADQWDEMKITQPTEAP